MGSRAPVVCRLRMSPESLRLHLQTDGAPTTFGTLVAFRIARSRVLAWALAFTWNAPCLAHHEALFGPQSSLAVESPYFVSMQMHVHAVGSGKSYADETTYILSAGAAPVRNVPWALAVVQPFTYEYARTPSGDQTGPFSSCGGCSARENPLIATSYRFDFTGLQQLTGKDGNFALVSGSIEPPLGNKDYREFHGPFNFIVAALAGLEWREWSTVALGYYRVNLADSVGSKKGNNSLLGIGGAYTPIDDDQVLSFQLGAAVEVHERDVLLGTPIEATGGWEMLASPTVVWSPAPHLRFFTLVSLPIAQNYRAATPNDRWRSGLGMIYAFGAAPQARTSDR